MKRINRFSMSNDPTVLPLEIPINYPVGSNARIWFRGGNLQGDAHGFTRDPETRAECSRRWTLVSLSCRWLAAELALRRWIGGRDGFHARDTRSP